MSDKFNETQRRKVARMHGETAAVMCSV